MRRICAYSPGFYTNQGFLTPPRAFYSQILIKYQDRLNQEIGTLVYAQETAIIHQILSYAEESIRACLIDVTNVASVSTNPVEKGRAVDVLCQVLGRWLNERFMKKPLLIKLLHFQTYSHTLLPLLEPFIPSLHVALDWLPELLTSPEDGKRRFAAHLAGTIAFCQYRVTFTHTHHGQLCSSRGIKYRVLTPSRA